MAHRFRNWWLFPANAACVLLAAAALSSCSPTDHRIILYALRERFHYYECVPLGWVPVPVDGTYVQGYSAELDQTDWWLPPKWVGSIRIDRLKHRDARVTYALLNELVRVGMLDRNRVKNSFRYHLTWRALSYYFDENDFGNNPEHYSFLCYSKIAPQRVVWNEPIHRERIGGSETDVFRAKVEWLPGPVAAWAEDAFLQSHSVTLVPARDPNGR